MKNQVIKAALFDLDGVVVFTDKYHYLAWKKLADENGWEFDEQVNQRLRGIPRIASLEEILRHNNTDLGLNHFNLSAVKSIILLLIEFHRQYNREYRFLGYIVYEIKGRVKIMSKVKLRCG